MVSFTIDDQPHNGRVVVRRDGKLTTIYHYHGFLFKPYFYPVIGPAGTNLTADIPSDHPHHRSIWVAHHEVNGVDFYYEHRDEGRILHEAFTRWWKGPARPGFEAVNRWVAPDGRRILSDRRTVRFGDEGDGAWSIDLLLTLVADSGDVDFSDTKEAGLPLVRVADDIDEFDGGRITAPGGKTGEEATFGLRAPWVDYSGKEHGLTLMDHPTNPNHPPGLFTRSYGPISTREGFMFDGGCRLQAGEEVSLWTRILIHPGGADEAAIEEHFRRFAALTPEDLFRG